MGEASGACVPRVQGQGIHDHRDQRGGDAVRHRVAGDCTGHVLQDATLLALPWGRNGEGGTMSENSLATTNLSYTLGSNNFAEAVLEAVLTVQCID